MIIRSQQENESLVQRMLRRTFPKTKTGGSTIYSPEAFLLEIAKESARSNRRSLNQEFVLILIRFDVSKTATDLTNRFVTDLRQRLRVYDVVGWFDEQLGVLLPETDRQNGHLVANEIIRIGLSVDLVFDTEVHVYPWDDEMAAVSESLGTEFDDDDSSNGGIGQQEVVDQAHSELVSAQLASGMDGSSTQQFSTIDQRSCMIAFSPSLPTPWWKQTVDLVGASIGLLLLSPVFLAAAVAIKLNSKGPVLFKQLREGKDGRQFGIWKFRTMRVDAEAEKNQLLHQSEQDGPAFKIKDDPRLTTVGRYLRKSCVDELPQLFNVLRGEMSLVGPRPLPVDESFACRPWQRHRLTVLPGLTCVWQVQGGLDTKFDDWMRMDLEYIRCRGFFYDLKLIFRTVFYALMFRGSV